MIVVIELFVREERCANNHDQVGYSSTTHVNQYVSEHCSFLPHFVANCTECSVTDSDENLKLNVKEDVIVQ